jgi:hypothetical protein
MRYRVIPQMTNEESKTKSAILPPVVEKPNDCSILFGMNILELSTYFR